MVCARIAQTIKHNQLALTTRRKQMAEKGYCVKCKDKKEMKNEEKVTMKNGRSAMKGKCSTCGTGMYKILGKA